VYCENKYENATSHALVIAIEPIEKFFQQEQLMVVECRIP
jgi:hypothetical protein